MGIKWYIYSCFDLYLGNFISLSISLYAGPWYYRCLLGAYKRVLDQECEWELRSIPHFAWPGRGIQLLRGRLIFAISHQSNICTSLGHIFISHIGFKFWEFLPHILSLHLSERSCLFLLILSFLAYHNPFGVSDICTFLL